MGKILLSFSSEKYGVDEIAANEAEAIAIISAYKDKGVKLNLARDLLRNEIIDVESIAAKVCGDSTN